VYWLNIIDEYSRKYLASIPRRKWSYKNVIEILSGLFVANGSPAGFRSDNGSEFTAVQLMDWLKVVGVSTAFIEPGRPCENGFCESFNSKMRDEFFLGCSIRV